MDGWMIGWMAGWVGGWEGGWKDGGRDREDWNVRTGITCTRSSMHN